MKLFVIGILCCVVFFSIPAASINGGRTEKASLRLAGYEQLVKVSSTCAYDAESMYTAFITAVSHNYNKINNYYIACLDACINLYLYYNVFGFVIIELNIM